MCYAKPGPRCAGHLSTAMETARTQHTANMNAFNAGEPAPHPAGGEREMPNTAARTHHHSSPRIYACIVRRFRPAMEAVGFSLLGQCSWQLWCEWQA